MRRALRTYEDWLKAYGARQRARAVSGGAGNWEPPGDAAWWEEYLAEGLGGIAAGEGPPDAVENPTIPVMVVEMAREEESARMLVSDLLAALFAARGVRAYAGPVECSGSEILDPLFVVAIRGRSVLYEGEWLLKDFALPSAERAQVRALHGRLVAAVAGWQPAW